MRARPAESSTLRDVLAHFVREESCPDEGRTDPKTEAAVDTAKSAPKVTAARISKKSKGFKKISKLNEVTGRHNQILQCLHCPKTFTKLCNVKDHVRTHIGLRPFSCK